jgi:hypothetical protein
MRRRIVRWLDLRMGRKRLLMMKPFRIEEMYLWI